MIVVIFVLSKSKEVVLFEYIPSPSINNFLAMYVPPATCKEPVVPLASNVEVNTTLFVVPAIRFMSCELVFTLTSVLPLISRPHLLAE